MRTFLSSFAVLALSVAVGSAASAITEYGYSGNTYTNIVDNTPPPGTTYTTSMSVTGIFSVAVPLAANMALTDVTADVVSYTFDDGVNSHTESNSIVLGAFNIATDGAGNISEWQITTTTGPPLPTTGGPGDQRQLIQTANVAGLVLDRGILQECTGGSLGTCGAVFSDVGQVTNQPGSWAIVPEPSSASLLALGLIGLAARRSAGLRRRG